jgi:hypothetical protein
VDAAELTAPLEVLSNFLERQFNKIQKKPKQDAWAIFTVAKRATPFSSPQGGSFDEKDCRESLPTFGHPF